MRFTDALDRKAEEIQRPPNLPMGHYTFAVKAVPEIEDFESAKTGDTFDRVQFQMACIEAQDDVDEDELTAFGNVSGQTLRKTFLFNTTEGKESEFARSEYNLKRFLVDHLGLDESMTMEELLNAAVNAQCIAEVTHRPDPSDPEIVYAELGRTTAL
jgi:hypothetical protein